MPAPKVDHGGFLVPNAKDVTDPVMAEPDRIDFNTVANARWGVINGCLIQVAGRTATTVGGTALVNGALIKVKVGSATLGIGGTQDRFDLIVTDTSGDLKVIAGTGATDPVFPDPPPNVTVLAVVFCPTGSGDFSQNVVDKRKFLADSLLTQLDAGAPLIYNLNGSASLFSVSGDGGMKWGSDTHLFRTAEETLRLSRHLRIDGSLTVGQDITATNVTASAWLTGTNLRHGNSVTDAGNGVLGAIFQQTADGRVFIWAIDESGQPKWRELATVDGIVPVGSIIQSMEIPAVMRPKGWIPLQGGTVSEDEAPRLFTVSTLAQYIISGTNPRVMQLPNANRRVLLTDWADVGKTGGTVGFQVKLLMANMPIHKHAVGINPGGAHTPVIDVRQSGGHNHPITGGRHGHALDDPGHMHPGTDFFGHHLHYIGTVLGGKNKLDALFNDSSHTHTVDLLDWTGTATTGIRVSADNSEHVHNVGLDGAHDHPASANPVPNHDHVVTEEQRGGNDLVDFTPAHLTIFTYIRS